MNHRVFEIIAHAETYGIVPHYQTIPKFSFDDVDNDAKYFRIWNHQLKFLKTYDRIEYDLTKERLVDVITKMDNEDERAIDVRVIE